MKYMLLIHQGDPRHRVGGVDRLSEDEQPAVYAAYGRSTRPPE